MRVSVIGELTDAQFVIMPDSFSALRSISNIRNRQLVIRKQFLEIAQMRDRNKDIEMCCIPSHVEIQWNEEADRTARRSAQYIRVYYKD